MVPANGWSKSMEQQSAAHGKRCSIRWMALLACLWVMALMIAPCRCGCRGRHPNALVIVPPRTGAVASSQTSPTQRDGHIRNIAAGRPALMALATLARFRPKFGPCGRRCRRRLRLDATHLGACFSKYLSHNGHSIHGADQTIYDPNCDRIRCFLRRMTRPLRCFQP